MKPGPRPWSGTTFLLVSASCCAIYFACSSSSPPAPSETPAAPMGGVASASTSTVEPAADPGEASAPVPQPALPPDPPPTPHTATPAERARCDALGKKIEAYLQANRRCKSEADCAEVYTSCGTSGVCGTHVSQDKQAGLEAISKELEAAQCFAIGAVPCPTCNPPPPPRCERGQCR